MVNFCLSEYDLFKISCNNFRSSQPKSLTTYLLRITSFFFFFTIADTLETPAYSVGLSKRKSKDMEDLHYRSAYRRMSKTRQSLLDRKSRDD